MTTWPNIKAHPHFRGVMMDATGKFGTEQHALIYTDGVVALTILTGVTGAVADHTLWWVHDGTSVDDRDSMQLTAASLDVLRRHSDGVISVALATARSCVVNAKDLFARVPDHRVADKETARVRLMAAERHLAEVSTVAKHVAM